VVRVLLLLFTTVAIFYAVPRAAEAGRSDCFLLDEWFCDLTRPGRPFAYKHAVYSLVLVDRKLN